MAFRTSFAAVFLVSAACQPDISFVPKDPDPEPTYPVILVDPRTLDFGEQTSLDTVRQTVTVTNNGYNTLDVSELTLSVPPSFTVEASTAWPQLIEPAGTWTFDVVFHPLDAGLQEGVITVVSDAMNEPSVPVGVSGSGALPRLEITPDPMRFGELFIPCAQEQLFTLRNVGSEPLVLSSVMLGGAASSLSFPILPPADLTLDLNESYTLPVRFDPSIADRFGAELVVASNDPGGDAHVPITGSARFAQEVTEQYVVPENLPIDVLIAIDQSCSMATHQAQLNSQFASFIQVFASANVAWKVGVLTEQNGCMTIFNAQTPNWASLFTNAISGTDHGLTEALLQLTKTATLAGCNAGFRDPGAPLQIIIVSDERDQSSGWGTANYWSQYVTAYRAYAGAGAPMKVHGVLDTNWQTGGSEEGPAGYNDAISATGGTMLNIYDNNWPSALSGIAQQAVADIGVYELGQRNPDASSVRVWVDGTEWTTGWHYDAARNAVVLDSDPAPNSVIDVSYGVAVNCGP